MEFNSGITSFGHHRHKWVSSSYEEEEILAWKVDLSARLDTLLRETFIESSITEAIQACRYADDFTVNTATIEISLLSLQNYLGFVFPHPREVIDYLLKHRDLYDITLLACLLTEDTFGDNSQISLELYHDPEIHDEYLTIFVRQDEYEPDILDKIDTISREYEQGLVGVAGYLLVNTDFQPPTV